jgi:hypothetical protein
MCDEVDVAVVEEDEDEEKRGDTEPLSWPSNDREIEREIDSPPAGDAAGRAMEDSLRMRSCELPADRRRGTTPPPVTAGSVSGLTALVPALLLFASFATLVERQVADGRLLLVNVQSPETVMCQEC